MAIPRSHQKPLDPSFLRWKPYSKQYLSFLIGYSLMQHLPDKIKLTHNNCWSFRLVGAGAQWDKYIFIMQGSKGTASPW